MTECLYAQFILCITDCVIAELEKVGKKYRTALKIAKDPKIEKITCSHIGTYADECLYKRVLQHRCIIATCDRELRQRIKKILGVPIVYIKSHRYKIEGLNK